MSAPRRKTGTRRRASAGLIQCSWLDWKAKTKSRPSAKRFLVHFFFNFPITMEIIGFFQTLHQVTATGCHCATWWRTASGTGRTRAKISPTRSGTAASPMMSAKCRNVAWKSGMQYFGFFVLSIISRKYNQKRLKNETKVC